MRPRFHRLGWLAVAAACGMAACGGGTESDADIDTEPDSEPVGRGSDACHEWQDAFCDFSSDQCGNSSRATCDDQARAITCRSDAEAEACVESLRAATCDAPPMDCELTDLADPAPAIAACEELVRAGCEVANRCAGTDVEECLADSLPDWDCPSAVGTTLDFEDCITELEDLACDAPVPEVCNRVVLT